MKFNKEQFKADAKELLKSQGKEHLSEFVEDVAFTGWDIIKLVAKHTEGFMIDDMVVASMDGTVKDLIDKIDGEKEL